ncbi:membrane-associated guanylate kinase, WW and PDZ domain-containing protein 1 isoform X1 [Tachysurus ichikawai]
MSKSIQKRKHWSSRVNESSLCRSSDGGLSVELHGGAQSGKFSYITAVTKDVVYQYGQISEGEILLEVEGLPVSGLPLYDVLALLDNTKDPVRLKTVRQGELWDRKH